MARPARRRYTTPMRYLIAALTLLPTLVLADVAGPARVIDGDTIEVAGQRIRLHGIDAPEGRQSCRRDAVTWPCGAEAARALRRSNGLPIAVESPNRYRDAQSQRSLSKHRVDAEIDRYRHTSVLRP